MKEITRINFAIIGDLAYDQSITPRGSRRVLAGSAYNVAVAAATVAETGTVGVVARVGHDFQEGIGSLHRRGIDIEGILIVPRGKTAVFTITEHEDNTRELQAELGVSEQVNPHIFPESYRTSSWVHLASSHPEKYLRWIPYLRRSLPQSTIISADANDLFIETAIEATVAALKSVDLVFINEAELAAIRARCPDFVLNVPLILKKGNKGASYIDMLCGIEYSVSAPSVEVVDTSGAGDTLAGVFLAEKAKGISDEKALEDGVNTASKTVTNFGVEHINPLV